MSHHVRPMTHAVSEPDPARQGMAMIMVLAILVVMLGLLFVATDRMTVTAQQSAKYVNNRDAAIAVETVLLRRENDVARLAVAGDASNFSTYGTSGIGKTELKLTADNYGVDYVNGFAVRWKIEPTMTAYKAYSKDVTTETKTAIPAPINFIANPSPDPKFNPIKGNTSRQQDNDTLYLYRVAAEARTIATGNSTSTAKDQDSDGKRMAQGIRYVSVNREPMFRYVIFYAQKGSKGDLEMTHADGVDIAGSIHSNGSIYFGSGGAVNDKLSQLGSIDPSTFTQTATKVGPDGSESDKVKVIGLDGIFRLSKPMMFSLVNQFPLANTPVPAVGTPIGQWTAEGTYNTVNAMLPLEDHAPGSLSIAEMTNKGKAINPYRIKSGSGAVTRSSLTYPMIPASSTADNARRVNGIALIGSSAENASIGNDSRDFERSAEDESKKWKAVADTVFLNSTLTYLNGGTYKPVKAELTRGFEAQKLQYIDQTIEDVNGKPTGGPDGDVDTDDHEYALPYFYVNEVVTSGGSSAVVTKQTQMPFAADMTDKYLAEVPGYYVNQALGATNTTMVRQDSGEGWDIKNAANPASITVAESKTSGIIIRERPIPATSIWPGTRSVDLVSPLAGRYMPYAYGKQFYPTTKPFTPIDVSDNFMRIWRWDNNPPCVTSNIGMTATTRVASYNGGGAVTITSSSTPGSNVAQISSNMSTNATNNVIGTWVNTTPASTAYNGALYSSLYQRKTYFYRDPWRFMHLGAYVPDKTKNGLLQKYYQDTVDNTTERTYCDEALNSGGQNPLPFNTGLSINTIAVTSPSTGIVSVSNGVPAIGTATIPSNSYLSTRWVGFFKAPQTGSYTFNTSIMANTAYMARLFINGAFAWEKNQSNQPNSQNSNTPAAQNLTAGEYYPLVLDLVINGTTSAVPTSAPTLIYQVDGGTGTAIATGDVFPPDSTVPSVIPRANFTAMECRIDNPHAITGTGAKVGLMIRPEQSISPLAQGGSAYGMVGWSQARGFFTQRRLAPAAQSKRVTGTYYIGAGSDIQNGVDYFNAAKAEIPDTPTSAGVTRTAQFSTTTVLPVSPTVFTVYGTGSVYSPTTISYSSTPPLKSGQFATTGFGPTLLNDFYLGPYIANARTFKQWKQRSDRYVQRLVIGMSNQVQPMLTTDGGKFIAFFRDLTGNSGLPNVNGNGMNGTIASYSTTSPPTPNNWFLCNAAGGVNSPNPTLLHLARDFMGNAVSGVQVFGATAACNPTYGTSATVWPVNPPMMMTVNGILQTATATAVRDVLVANGVLPSGTTVTIKSTSTPSSSDISANNPSATAAPMPTNAQVDAATGGIPALPALTSTNPLPPLPVLPTAYTTSASVPAGTFPTFAITRASSSFYFDLNPWITKIAPDYLCAGSTNNFATNANLVNASEPAYLPRAASMPITSNGWTGSSPTTWPVTLGQRPDVWSGAKLTMTPNQTTTQTQVKDATVTTLGSVSLSGGSLNPGDWMQDDYQPSGFASNGTTEVWVRIEQDASGNVTFKGYAGTTPPTSTSWVTIGNTLNTTGWGPGLLLGPCVQGGTTINPVTANFSNLKITTTLPAPYDVIDQKDWDSSASNSDDLAAYLMSQYQVFFGTREITTSFFKYKNASGNRIATEDWFFQPREFWSQTRTWDHTVDGTVHPEKDAFVPPDTTFTSYLNRKLLGKTTVLTIDMEVFQNYLRSVTLKDAKSFDGSKTQTNSNENDVLASSFNGILYMARTNRYPWNPMSNPQFKDLPLFTSNPYGAVNPYSPAKTILLPNSVTKPGTPEATIANGSTASAPPFGITATNRSLKTWTDPKVVFTGSGNGNGKSKLMPYSDPVEAPAFKPQTFIHGVRIKNARNINWAHGTPSSVTAHSGVDADDGADLDYGTKPKFGTSKMSIVTPNALYVQGSLNTYRHMVNVSGQSPAEQPKSTPLALMADSIILQSNAWNDAAYQVDDMTVSNVGGLPAGQGTLACKTQGAPASATWYYAGLVTNNIPTTKRRVMEGQAAPFVDSMMFLENWAGVKMTYIGSLVVMDTKRYSNAFLLSTYKTYGQTPFGVNGSSDWLTILQKEPENAGISTVTPQWLGMSPTVYGEPIRKYSFNTDFLTSQGTPPEIPFGVSSGGVGGWVRTFK